MTELGLFRHALATLAYRAGQVTRGVHAAAPRAGSKAGSQAHPNRGARP
jgi:hypothetical protein